MCAALDYPAVVDDKDLACPADGGQPVCDHQRGAAREGDPQRLLDRCFRFRVQVRGGLVEDNDRRGLEQEPGQGDALLLSSGQAIPAVSGHRVEPVGKGGNQIPDLRRPACFDHVCLAGARSGVEEVTADGVMEHVRVLGDDADRVVQGGQGQVAQVAAAYPHDPRGGVIQPGHQVSDRGLAGPREADEGGQLPSWREEADLVQYLGFVAFGLGIGQRDRLERGD